MHCYDNKSAKRLLFCCDLDSETVLILISIVLFYITLALFLNVVLFYCTFTVFVYIILIFFYFISGLSLFLGVFYQVRALIIAFLWYLLFALIACAVLAVMIYWEQECIAKNVDWVTHRYILAYYVSLPSEYFIVNFITGLNFVIGLYVLLVVTDYLAESDSL